MPWPLRGRSIAIIEDDRTCATIAASICRRLGATETFHFATGADAVTALSSARQRVDLVLLDMMLGEVDGLSAFRMLDSEAVLAGSVPVSVSDARVLDAAVQVLAQRGFKVHTAIEKPLTAEKLATALSSLLAH